MSKHTGQKVIYRRVSTADQSTLRQLHDEMHFDREFEDKCSGKNTDRPQLKECLEYLRSGDTLYVHSIDRLARNLKDLLDIVTSLTSKHISIVFMKENLTFTGEDNPMQNLQISIIGAVAQFERDLINTRIREGIAAKKQKDPTFWKDHCGRKKAFTADRITEIKKRVAAGEKIAPLAREYGISRTCLYSYLKAA